MKYTKGALISLVKTITLAMHKNRHRLLNFCIFLCLALIATYPAFLGHFLNTSHDGIYHLGRLQQISDTLKEGKIPQVVNFNYISLNSYRGVAINSFYPWLTGLIFIVPYMILHNPMWALVCGFVILNFLTIFCIQKLLTYLNIHKLALYTGIIIYEFNNFHMLDLYSRMAIGEAIAYAFFPLVILGLLMINRHNKRGYLVLGLAMGLLINTHILSFTMALLLVIVYGLFTCFKRTDITFKFIQIIKAGIIGLILGFYIIYNIISITIQNSYLKPLKLIIPLNANDTFHALLANSIADYQISAWNLGLPVTAILIVLFIIGLVKTTNSWQKWIISSGLLYCVLFSWLPFNIIATSPISLFQFLGRIIVVVALFLAIGASLFVQEINLHRSSVAIINIFIVAFSITATYNFHYTYSYQQTDHVKITNSNYYDVLNNTATFRDYLPTKSKQSTVSVLQNINFKKISILSEKATASSVAYRIHSNSHQYITLPVVLYKGLNYEVYTNKQTRKISENNIVRVKVIPGNNDIIVKSIGNYHLFALLISLLGFIGMLFYSLWNTTKNFRNSLNIIKFRS